MNEAGWRDWLSDSESEGERRRRLDAFLEDFAGYMFMIEGLCQEFYGSVCQPFSRHCTLNAEFNEVFHSGDSDLGSRRWTYDDGVLIMCMCCSIRL